MLCIHKVTFDVVVVVVALVSWRAQRERQVNYENHVVAVGLAKMDENDVDVDAVVGFEVVADEYSVKEKEKMNERQGIQDLNYYCCLNTLNMQKRRTVCFVAVAVAVAGTNLATEGRWDGLEYSSCELTGLNRSTMLDHRQTKGEAGQRY